MTILIITCESEWRCKLRPSQRAMVVLMYLREHTTPAKTAVGFRIGESTAHAYTSTVVDLLASRAAALHKTLRDYELDFVLPYGTLAECDRAGDGRAHHSHKHRRHSLAVQVVTDPDGRLLWGSPVLPGHTHYLTAARTHRIMPIRVTTLPPWAASRRTAVEMRPPRGPVKRRASGFGPASRKRRATGAGSPR
ncbi:hypothetical protein GCM10010305_20330 [Streptomyces termitum]|uniref:Transposase Helix-turn-helix domain-containing protein n=1 Tax=Streptomyces termitum TaxID=67368 RepID=A0A918W7I4_9ACTN|nr:hypothetical protein GCM10010305_20330 [Streptomyces termitum]